MDRPRSRSLAFPGSNSQIILFPPAGYEPKFGVYLLVTTVSTFFCLTTTTITTLLYFVNHQFNYIIQVLRLRLLEEGSLQLRSGAIFVEIGWILLEISFIKVDQQNCLQQHQQTPYRVLVERPLPSDRFLWIFLLPRNFYF